jgi:isopentenyldiphosphate isomerase
VVNGEDHVVAQASRGKIHRARLRHRAVHILVFNPAGEVFLQRRAWWKECAPGLWDTSAAGHLGAGESYADAAGRELAEELGVPVTGLLTRLFKLPASEETGFEFVEVFMTTVTQPLTPDPVEIIDSRWCSVRRLEFWLEAEPAAFTGTFRQIWAHWRAAQTGP